VTADFLRFDLSARLDLPRPFRVAGNLPYNVSTPILFRLLDLSASGQMIGDATVMLQREVAERLMASPGTEAWGALSACVQLRADVSPRLELPPGAFRPAPKVHSSVIRIAFRASRPAVRDLDLFDRLVIGLFTKRRKMLSNALAPMAEARGMEAAAVIAAAGVDPRCRPETLRVEELARLADLLSGA